MARLAKNPSAGEHRSSGLGIAIRFISPFSVITTRSVLSTPPLSSVTKMSAMVHRVNLAPAVRSAASGVPRSAVNFAIKGVHGGIGSGHAADEHGQHGPRRDAIPSWVGSRGAYMQSTNVNGECRGDGRNGVRERKDVDGCRVVISGEGGGRSTKRGKDAQDAFHRMREVGACLTGLGLHDEFSQRGSRRQGRIMVGCMQAYICPHSSSYRYPAAPNILYLAGR